MYPLEISSESRKQILSSATLQQSGEPKFWFVMRDLKRFNAHQPAYKMLTEARFEVFTPMKWRINIKNGKRIREEVPVVHDLLFVHDSRTHIDPIVDKTPTLQYRYLKNAGYCQPMVVKDSDMERFMQAVKSTDNPRYYLPSEITSAMCGRQARIVGGMLDGYEGKILSVRGSKRKQLLVELPGFFTLGVEIEPDYIQLL